MTLRRMFVGLSVLFIIGLPLVAASLPEETPEAPFASDQTPDQLVIVCGIPREFDPLHVAAPAPQKPTAAFSPTVTMQDVEIPSTQVPEPSTLVLVGLGVIGLIAFVRRTRT